MIFELTLNKVKVKRDIPTDWDQVKFKDLLKLQNAKELTALSVFTGVYEETLKKAKIQNMDALINALSFIRKEVPLFKLPKKILDYEIRPDLGFEPFGRYTDIKDEIDKGKTGLELLEQYPLICAIYTHQGEYNFKEAEKNLEQFLNAPCTEVLALGNFLLMKLLGLSKPTEKVFPLLRILPKRLRLVLKLWRSRLAFQLRYFFWRKKALTPLKNFTL